MDYAKLQSEIIKLLIKAEQTEEYVEFMWGDAGNRWFNTDSHINVLIDKHRIFFIPKTLWMIDPPHRYNRMDDMVSRLHIADLDGLERALKTGVDESDRKRVLVKYETPSGKEAWFNEKLLKLYGSDAVLFIKDHKSIAMIQDEAGSIIGTICPVRR